MALSDSMFLFEIIVEELKSFSKYKEFCISTQFADIFQLYLRDPNDSKAVCPNRKKKKIVKKSKVRGNNSKTDKISLGSRVTVGQTILIENNLYSLRSNMKQYPLELFLCSKVHPDVALGSALIPWSETFIDYLSELNDQQFIPSVSVNGTHNVFDEFTSKCMATIKLNIKLSCLKEKLTTQFRSRSEDQQKHLMYTSLNSSPTTIMSTMEEKEEYVRGETGTIKTIYAGGKTKPKRSSYNKSTTNKAAIKKELNFNKDFDDVKDVIDVRMERIRKNRLVNDKIIGLVKSEIDVEAKKVVPLMKSQSSSMLEHGNRINTLNYIFGDQRGPFGNQVYYVGYFTVQNDFAKEPVSSRESMKDSKSSDKSEEVEEKFKFKICADECPSKKASELCSPSHCSLDLPQEAAHLITVKKCDRVDCDSKKHREPPGPPDERLFVDMSSTKRQCCDFTEKVEQVVGGMQAKMKIGNAPCYCSCECTFGFTKKTTYCNVCGGFELVGEEKLGQQTFPCPIFHKLVDKNKLKSVYSSGSDTRRKGDDSQRSMKGSSKADKRSLGDKSGESEKDNKKGKKKKKDDRFKFNYGYQAPQIGHSQCAMPCTGSLGAVPKNMGWLWTADNIPGLKAPKGWKPGAISKRLLCKLNKAKRQTSAVETSKPLKKLKKRTETKPTLIICKVNGEYRVEMQTAPENNEGSNEQYTPLVYKIAKADNKDKLAKLELKRRQLVKEIIGDFEDPYHPDVCEKTCLKAYKQAIGLLPLDPNRPDCTCSDGAAGQDSLKESCHCYYDDVSSDCSSMDIDWEIHFSPPIASHS